MAQRVIHFEIQADDPERAKNFYASVLGWDISKYGGDGPMDYWMLKTGPDGTPGINGGMYKRGERPLHTYDCTIQVDNIDTTIAAIKEHGGTVTADKVMMEGLGWFARATDTEGNTFGLMQPTEWEAK